MPRVLNLIAFMRGWWPRLRPVDVLRWLADPQRLRRYGNGVLSGAEAGLLARSLAGDGVRERQRARRDFRHPRDFPFGSAPTVGRPL